MIGVFLKVALPSAAAENIRSDAEPTEYLRKSGGYWRHSICP
jgi:hypothetical protein